MFPASYPMAPSPVEPSPLPLSWFIVIPKAHPECRLIGLSIVSTPCFLRLYNPLHRGAPGFLCLWSLQPRYPYHLNKRVRASLQESLLCLLQPVPVTASRSTALEHWALGFCPWHYPSQGSSPHSLLLRSTKELAWALAGSGISA